MSVVTEADFAAIGEYLDVADSLWKAQNIEFSGELSEIPGLEGEQMFDFDTGQYDVDYLIKAREAGINLHQGGNVRQMHYDILRTKEYEKIRQRTPSVWEDLHRIEQGTDDLMMGINEMFLKGNVYRRSDDKAFSPYELYGVGSKMYYQELDEKGIEPGSIDEILEGGRIKRSIVEQILGAFEGDNSMLIYK